MPQVPLIRGDRVSTDTDYRDALAQNMYAVDREILGTAGYMLCYPGLTKLADGSGSDRGAFYNDRQRNLFRVSGQKLISVSSAGAVTELGGIPGSSQAELDYSFNTQCIIADGNMYLYGSSGFQQVTDSDLGNPLDVQWIDGYYFLTDGEFIYHTNIADETAIDPLKFATAEFMPDASLGLGKTSDDKVIVFGRYSTEFFANVATANFAFTRIETRSQKIGIVATHAKCESKGRWYITGGSREDSVSVYLMTSGAPEKVATREIDKLIAQYTEPELSDIRMECRVEDDVNFILLHLPNETLCFNETIARTQGIKNAWTRLRSGVQGQANYQGINGVFDSRSSRWVFGNKFSQVVGYIDNTVFTQYDEIQEWLLYTPFVKIESASINEVEMETIPGHTSFDDAVVSLSLTYDGLTYGKEWFEFYGQPLDYGKRFIIRRLGYVGDWVGFKFRGTTRSRMSFARFNLEFS